MTCHEKIKKISFPAFADAASTDFVCLWQ
ncbi:Protein of unknown function [Lactobacillus acidophilus DSM 20079 = JCM 1132 = NBRC 13951 = CIP 76.13]|nr:Protein of unknown function [Lactobacillus acidophilus DSM 20079 = JCM 1132 = NBRC 13951 = CIP 76.13]CDF69040.1 Protein of unknown function [Lactobacillus acidophilus CIRM-BIA 442]CDF70811.1 Protein of unknown function [Lactobacillus acidophilus CIRM-BIA 445]CDF74615.1 Protein of unknown function [Lactobacillus acidophilus DSM 20242]